MRIRALGQCGTAEFSGDRKYRYALTRNGLTKSDLEICFIMLNPSIADAEWSDATVHRCEKRARALGYARLSVVNLFGWISSYPADLRKTIEPIGARNDARILHYAERADTIVCAWGRHGRYLDRQWSVLKLLSAFNLYAFGLNNDDTPKHPLYLDYEIAPSYLWKPALLRNDADYIKG